MSLETQIAELNENVVKLIAALGNGAAANAKPSPASKDEGDETPAKPKRRGRPKKEETEDKSESKKSAKSDEADAPSVEAIREVFGNFMRVDDEEDREKRKTFVKNVLKQFDVKRATELKEEDRQAAIDVIQEEGKRLETAEDDGDLV